MRILVTVKPRMYREAIGLALHKHRPDAEVLLAAPEFLDGQADSFAPHVLLRNDTDGEAPGDRESVVCRIEVLFSDGLGARISLDGRVWNIEDISTDDMVAILEEVEGLIGSR